MNMSTIGYSPLAFDNKLKYNVKRIIPMTILFCLLILVVLFPGLQLLRQTPSEIEIFPNAVDDKFVDQIDFSQASPAPVNTKVAGASILKQTGWIPDWAFDSGYTSFTANYQYFDSISPVWYYLEDNGQIRSNPVGYDQIRSFTKDHNIKLIPSISNFDADQLDIVLSDPQKLQNHADYLISEISQYDYDGIDIDYESIYLSDKASFYQLLSILHDYLSQNGKTLTVSVIPSWSNRPIRTNLRQTIKTQQWGELAEYANEIRIMTYNLTGANSAYPGPIAPLDWMDAVLRYAVTQVDMSKVMLGVNLYGYDGWENTPVPTPYLGLNANPTDQNYPATAYNYDQITDHQVLGVSTSTDPTTGEPQATYSQDGNTRVQFYADANFAALRADLAREYGIKGVGYWRLGNEDPQTYAAAAK